MARGARYYQVEKQGDWRHHRCGPRFIQDNHGIHPTARQLRVVEGLTGFANMSFPCFSTKALALLASSDSNQGS